MKHYSGSMGIACGMDFRDMSLEVTTVSRHTECPACVAVLLSRYPDRVQGLALPACCFAPEDAELGHKLYAAYNRAGERKGLNYAGAPCPVWGDLPEDVRVKWRAVATELRPSGAIMAEPVDEEEAVARWVKNWTKSTVQGE